MKKSYVTYKFRIYPNRQQIQQIEKTYKCCQEIWNLMLEDSLDLFLSSNQIKLRPAYAYTEKNPEFSEVDYSALVNVCMNLKDKYKLCLKENYGKRAADKICPKLKTSKNPRHSYSTIAKHGTTAFIGNKLRMPNLGLLKIAKHRQIPKDFTLCDVTVSRYAGKYYVEMRYSFYNKTPMVPKDEITHIGLDYKQNGLYVDSNGNIADMPHYFRQSEKKYSRQVRALDRKVKGSNNFIKQKLKVAKLAEHITNQRKDFLHKLSNKLTDEYSLISVESLDLQGIKGTHHFGKSINDNGYSYFVGLLEYKQKRKGHYLVKVDRYFPSSQLCQCGYLNPKAKNLNNETIICPCCGLVYNRDENAARNIDKEGLRIFLEN